MNFEIKEITSIKFYNSKTGEELTPMTFKESSEEEKNKRQELQKITGYADPCLCSNCGKYYEGYNGVYNLDGELRCEHCVKDDLKMKMPHFIAHIPAYCDGATCRIFTFKDVNDFYDKIKNKLTEGCVLVKSSDNHYIMEQSIEKKWWWVLGGINCFDDKINIPYENYDIYNKNETVNKDKVNKWLNGFDIISKDDTKLFEE